jgi:hypothetical protein
MGKLPAKKIGPKRDNGTRGPYSKYCRYKRAMPPKANDCPACRPTPHHPQPSKSIEMSLPNASFRMKQLATLAVVAIALSNFAVVDQAAAQAKPRVPKGGGAAAPEFNQSTVQFDTVIDFKGKLKDSVRNFMIVTKDDGTDVTIKLHDDPTRLRFVADAKRPYVRPQMMARAKVSLGPTGAPIAAVDHIELFQPVPTGAIAGSAKDAFTPGIHSKSHDKPNPQQGFMPGIYDVVGMVVGMDNNGVYLNTGRGAIAVPLSPEAKRKTHVAERLVPVARSLTNRRTNRLRHLSKPSDFIWQQIASY